MEILEQTKKDWLFILGAFLSKCDENYISARALWHQMSYDAAGNLFWLSIEQLIKLLCCQNEIENPNHLEQSQITNIENSQEKAKTICEVINGIFRKINKHHELSVMIDNIPEQLNPILESKKEAFRKINTLYNNRYYKYNNDSTAINLINDIDYIYFALRGHVSEKIPPATIDNIILDRIVGEDLFIPYHFYLHDRNVFVSGRKHQVVSKHNSMGKLIEFDGLTAKEWRPS